jgi:hypothetical protein
MAPVVSRLKAAGTRLWQTDKPLTAVGLLMVGALAVSLAGVWVDPRMITGAPAWLKPVKFAASMAIYTLTLSWVFTYLPAWRRTRRIVGWTTAVVMVLELIVIDLQAWRGTTSHFNVGTTLDATLFSVMGAAIVLQTLTSVAVAVALWRQPFADRALGWALRLGLSLTIIGAATGGLMTRQTAAQLDEARATRRIAIAGAHTVGAPDGGPGLPGTGWSREHGDLRVAHFVGLHAVQVLPVVALLIRRRIGPEAALVRLTMTAAASYSALFGILLWQALRAQPLLAADATTLSVVVAWGMLTGAAVWGVTSGKRRRFSQPAAVC